MAKHDENKDLYSIGKVCRIDYAQKVITTNKNTIIGIRRLGMLDYLTKYCGWHSFRTNEEYLPRREDGNNNRKKKFTREDKKASKTPKLTNKNKK